MSLTSFGDQKNLTFSVCFLRTAVVMDLSMHCPLTVFVLAASSLATSVSALFFTHHSAFLVDYSSYAVFVL